MELPKHWCFGWFGWLLHAVGGEPVCYAGEFHDMENLAEQWPCFRYGGSRKLGWRSALTLVLVAGAVVLGATQFAAAADGDSNDRPKKDPPPKPSVSVTPLVTSVKLRHANWESLGIASGDVVRYQSFGCEGTSATCTGADEDDQINYGVWDMLGNRPGYTPMLLAHPGHWLSSNGFHVVAFNRNIGSATGLKTGGSSRAPAIVS